jgi:hypothetical protein
MPLANPASVIRERISYSKWSLLAENNKTRYFEHASSKYTAAFGKLGVILMVDVDEASDVTDFETNFKPTGVSAPNEDELFELASRDSKIGQLDGRQQKAYEFGTTIIYIGYAEFGLAQSGSGWTIKKLDLDTSGNPTNEKWTGVEVATWVSRSGETYV